MKSFSGKTVFNIPMHEIDVQTLHNDVRSKYSTLFGSNRPDIDLESFFDIQYIYCKLKSKTMLKLGSTYMIIVIKCCYLTLVLRLFLFCFIIMTLLSVKVYILLVY